MKKLIAILAVLMLVVSVIPAVFAAEAVTVSVSGFQPTEENYLEKGKIVTVTISFDKEYNGFGGVVKYDPAVLEYVDKELPYTAGVFNPKNGIIGAGESENTTAVAVLMFKVLVDEGETTITLAPKSGKSSFEVTFNNEGVTENYAVSVNAGTIVIGKPAHVHAWGEWKTVKEADCVNDGLMERVCATCGEKETKPIPALGHKIEILPAKVATCTETGLTEGKKCSVCGEILVKQEVIPMIPHDEVTVPGKAATCTEDGLTDGKICSVCGTVLVEQKVIPALGHNVVFEEAPAAYDCDVEVVIKGVCKNGCGHEETKVINEKHGHEKGVTFEYVAATEEKDGYRKSYCAHKDEHGCSYIYTDVVVFEDDDFGDITPYITMTVVTVVALVSLAAYGLKRKHI